GSDVTSWDDVSRTIAGHGAGPLEVVVERDGRQLTLTADLILAERPVPGSEDEFTEVSFLGIAPTVDRYQPETIAGTLAWTGEFVGRTAQAVAGIPQRMVDVWDAAFGGGERGLDTPMSIVGAGRIGGEIASEDQLSGGQRIATFVMLLA